MKKYFIILISIFFGFNSFADTDQKIDSLKKVLAQNEHQSKATTSLIKANVDLLNAISEAYFKTNNYDSVLSYATRALFLSGKAGLIKEETKALGNTGKVYALKHNYNKAINYFRKAIENLDIPGFENKKYKVTIYNYLAICYSNSGDIADGLKYNILRLNVCKEIGDQTAIGFAYRDVASIYGDLFDYEDCLKNDLLSAEAFNKAGSKKNIAESGTYLGNMYVALGKYDDALKTATTELKLAQEIKDSIAIGAATSIMGDVYSRTGKYDEALKQYEYSIKISEADGNQFKVLDNTIGIAEIYLSKGDWIMAKQEYQKSLSVPWAYKDVRETQRQYRGLSLVFDHLNDYQSYFKYERLYRRLSDSIFSVDNQKKVNSLGMQYTFKLQQDSIKNSQAKKDALKENELKNQKRIRNYTLGGFAIMFIAAGLFFFQRRKIAVEKREVEKQKRRSDELLLNILPEEVAEELKAKGSAEAKMMDEVTVLFTDFKGFTQLSEQLSPTELVGEINQCFSAFDHIMEKYGIEKIKTIGDSYMAAGGLPTPNKTHPDDVVKAAIEIQQYMEKHRYEREEQHKLFFEIRIGIHTGPVVAGIVGVKKFQYDIWGDTVNTASRMESSGEVGKVNISGTTYELVKDKFKCVHRGKVQAKGKGEVDMYFVEVSSIL